MVRASGICLEGPGFNPQSGHLFCLTKLSPDSITAQVLIEEKAKRTLHKLLYSLIKKKKKGKWKGSKRRKGEKEMHLLQDNRPSQEKMLNKEC